MEVNFCDFSFKEGGTIGAHSVVGTRLYEDSEDPFVYYLGIYDSNYPGHEEYIRIEEKFLTSSRMKSTTLDTVRKSYEHTDYFHTTDLDKVVNYLKQ